NFILLENEKLQVDCSVKSQEIDLSDFVGSQKKGNDSYNLDFVKALDLELRLGVDKFSFKKFHASRISGNLNIHGGLINADQLMLNADGGTYKGRFSIDLNGAERYKVDARLDIDDINIHDLFVSFGDFGQEAIKADNIYGRASSEIEFSAYMLPDLTVLTETVEMTARVRIRDGNLKNYEPMRALSRFADIKELEDVRFSSLDNTISIHQSQVFIPKMDVISNVLSLQISGTHDFDNRIDYTMRLKLDDVLFSKKTRKAKKSEFDEHLVEVEKDDDPYIYVKMSGSADDPEITLDRKSLGNSISRDLKEQGKEIREIFRKEDPEEKKKEDPGIIFEWEEDSKGK
ncbi:MAG: AsmA-like C-terminal region-containing protein, partial [Owenweeksia sp.]